jgi:hypothetical protein
MRLDLRLTHRRLDQLWCQAVVVFVFEDDSLLAGYLSRLNEKLAGSLTQLIDRHFLTGKRGELLLVASQERIKADKVLFVGLGPTNTFSSETLSSAVKNVSSTLERLKLHEFGIMVPWIEKMKTEYVELIKSTIRNLVEYYSVNKRGRADCSLKTFFSIDEGVLPDLQSVGQELRGYLDAPAADYTIVIDDSRGLVNEKV